ncbi:hypothetical protein [Ornithinibacillus scapharcae]|nr:hypothetical protein [Ornithinibacillus scapharcae]
MNLGNDDTGAIGVLDADGGPERTNETVINDTSNPLATHLLTLMKYGRFK